MKTLVTWMRTLGNAGAIANARVLTEQRAREDFVLRSLRRRVAATAAAMNAA
jgi:hypothetical protein